MENIFLNKSVLKTKQKYGIFIIVNNERNIIEWLLYHFKLGFNYFFINDDNSNPSIKELINDYNSNEYKYFHDKNEGKYLMDTYGKIDLNKIDILIYNNVDKTKPVHLYYLCTEKFWNFVLPIIDNNVEYLLRIDADEYLTLNKNIKTVNNIFKNYGNFDMLKINWLFFGNNNHKKINSNLIINNYTKSHNVLNRHVKCIAKVKSISYMNNPHFFIMKNNSIIKNVLNNEGDMSPFDDNVKDYEKVDLYISHFMVQDTYSFFTRRFLKNTSNIVNIKKDKNDIDKLTSFFKNNLDNIIDYLYNSFNNNIAFECNNEHKEILIKLKKNYNVHNLNTNDNYILNNFMNIKLKQ